MSFTVVPRRLARVEFDEAFDWYESQRGGLGVAFANELNAVFNRISAKPELHAVVHQDVRGARVRDFPRNPDGWKSRTWDWNR